MSADGPDGAPGSGEQPVDRPVDPPVTHDETGLDLARSIAGSVARLPARAVGRRSGRRARPGPVSSSGTHPDDRDPQLLDATIGRLVAERGWAEDVRVHGVFSRWAAIVGPDVARHARPVSFERGDPTATPPGGRLTVQTDSTAWATEVRLLAGTVVRRLNEELGDGTVRVVDVKGPEAPSWRHGRRSLRDARGPRDTYG